MDHDPDKYLNECVAIDEFALQAEYMRLPADYAYWNARYAEVYRFLLRSKMTRDQLQARLHKEYRARLEAQRSSGRVTIAEVDAEVEADPEYLEAKVTEIEADAECKKLQGVMEALRTKREMLISAPRCSATRRCISAVMSTEKWWTRVARHSVPDWFRPVKCNPNRGQLND
jgi:hypothetical protein